MTAPDSYPILHDQQLFVGSDPIAPPSVLANDNDADGYPLTAILEQGPTHGHFEQFNSDGSFLYDPNPGFTGTDSFTYLASNGINESSPTTVTITVTVQTPTAVNDLFSLVQNYPLLHANVLANDIDPGDNLQPVILSQPQHGSVVINDDGTVTYTPNSQYLGPDSFSYEASNGILSSSPATVMLNVMNQHPYVNNDMLNVLHDQQLSGANVLTNDMIPTSNALLPIIVSAPQHGTAYVQGDGKINYQPNAGYVGSDVLTYKLNDTVADSNTATVTISVTNQAPVFGGTFGPPPGGPGNNPPAPMLSYNVLKNQSYSLAQLLQFGSDADGDALHVVVQQSPSHGQVTIQSDGTPLYTPNTGYTGLDSVNLTVNDGFANSNVATVNFNVVDFGLVANDDYIKVDGGPSYTIFPDDLLRNDCTLPNTSLQISQFSNPQNGTLIQNQYGLLVYTANQGFSGFDQFVYTATNGVNSSTATVRLQVWVAAGPPHLYSILLDDWNILTLAPGNNLTSPRLAALMDAPNLGRGTSAAIVALKLHVFQNGANAAQPGPYGSGQGNVFGNFQRQNGLTLADVNRFRSLCLGQVPPADNALVQRARALDNFFGNFYWRNSLPLQPINQQTPLFPAANLNTPQGKAQLAGSIYQGSIGDCSFVASMIGFARIFGNQLPGRIRVGQWQGLTQVDVVLFNPQTFVPETLVFPAPTIAQRLQYGGSFDGSSWFSCFETAYFRLRFNELNPNSLHFWENSYYYQVGPGPNGDSPANVIKRVTGSAATTSFNPANVGIAELERNLAAFNGRVVIVGAKANVAGQPLNIPLQFQNTTGLVPNHAYTVVGFDQVTHMVTLRNPWNQANRPDGRPGGIQIVISEQDLVSYCNILATESPPPAP